MARLVILVQDEALRRLEQAAKERRISPSRVAEEAVESYAWTLRHGRAPRFEEAARIVDKKLRGGS